MEEQEIYHRCSAQQSAAAVMLSGEYEAKSLREVKGGPTWYWQDGPDKVSVVESSQFGEKSFFI